MAILPQNPRDKNFFYGAVGAAVIAIAYITQLWMPKREELNASQAHVDSLLVINQTAKAELAQGRTQQLKAETERYAQDLDVMRHLVPTSNEVPQLLDQVSTAARRTNLEINDVQPLPTLSGDQYEAYKYRLSVRGAYHQIGVLLSNIGSLQRIVAPINLTLVPTSADPRAAKGLKVQPLEARFEIETYVSRTMPMARPVAAAKPAAEPGKPGEK